MKKSKKRGQKKGRWIIMLLVISIPLFYFVRKAYILVNSVYEERNMKKEILLIKARKELLRDRINEYKRGNLIEAKARDDLGMIRKGEKVYLVRD
jgi:cell division protein FtsB